MSLRNRVPELLAPAFPEATPASAPAVVTAQMPENAWAPWLNVPSRSDGSFFGQVQEWADFCRYREWKALTMVKEAQALENWSARDFHQAEYESWGHSRHVLDLILAKEEARLR